ncbi:hypothetical protein CRD36_17030 [Paremcibacter congregatus]|uniref:Uncharacterized protein n=1 Tax=Paremcibacter congregatus TaxID=2043170 RepID=A0A2G4YLS1_9PROT|nr:hypothetical protein CRD36_17030 [Paremcibacter congregatus]
MANSRFSISYPVLLTNSLSNFSFFPYNIPAQRSEVWMPSFEGMTVERGYGATEKATAFDKGELR